MPELQNFSNEFLFEPWKAPLDKQEEAGCIIGVDYPEPIVDHEEMSKENLAKLRQFFHSERSKRMFDSFLKPANDDEYRLFTYADFLDSTSDCDDF